MDGNEGEDQRITRATRGDERAIEDLMTDYLPGLHAFLRLRMGAELRAKESASDLAQSVCLDILRHIDRYQHRSDRNFKQWFYMTALRKVRNKAQYYKRGVRDVGREADLDSIASVYQTVSTPSQDMIGKEAVGRFEKAFDQLAADHQEIICLCRIAGLSHRDAGEVMGRDGIDPRCGRGR